MGCKNDSHWPSEMHGHARGMGGVAQGEERGVAENKHGGERGGKREKNLTCPPPWGEGMPSWREPHLLPPVLSPINYHA